MSNATTDEQDLQGDESEPASSAYSQETVEKLTADFKARLVAASLRTEAVKAGMIDLDGLKLLDQSAVELAGDDTVMNGQELMQTLRRNKPWLFRPVSSSSAAPTPPSRPPRQRTAMEMTDEEYATARRALLKH
jgi:hypothetical protein